MRCGIDLDGVVYQWSPTAREMLKETFGVVIGESQTWNWIKDHTTPIQWRWLWTEAVARGLFARGDAYPGAIETLRDLMARGDELVILAHRPPGAWMDTLRWLESYEVVPSEMHLYGNGGDKGLVPCDWYVEDRLDNALQIAATVFGSGRMVNRSVYLMDRPWNRDTDALVGAAKGWLRHVTRVTGWHELRRKVGLYELL